MGIVHQNPNQYKCRERFLVGVEEVKLWLIQLTTGWPQIAIPLPDHEHRTEIWTQAYIDEKRRPNEEAIETIARRSLGMSEF